MANMVWQQKQTEGHQNHQANQKVSEGNKSTMRKPGIPSQDLRDHMAPAEKALVVDLYAVQYAVPARKPKTQNKPQKQTSKNKKTTNQQQKSTNKAKTKQPKNTKKWDRYQQWGFMHDDILCVMMRMAPNKKQNKESQQKHQGPGQRV